jgi:hypothetical protein
MENLMTETHIDNLSEDLQIKDAQNIADLITKVTQGIDMSTVSALTNEDGSVQLFIGGQFIGTITRYMNGNQISAKFVSNGLN